KTVSIRPIIFHRLRASNPTINILNKDRFNYEIDEW
ncbi:MAG: hypothetical protein ACI9QN_001361, partial [Arcticibacterium sp.]